MITVEELIKIEEKLLKFEEKEKFQLRFNDYIKLQRHLEKIWWVTDKYFSLINEYKDFLDKRDLNIETYSRLMNNFMEQHLETKIDFDISKIKKFMEKNNIK